MIIEAVIIGFIIAISLNFHLLFAGLIQLSFENIIDWKSIILSPFAIIVIFGFLFTP